uniref:Uncharacterized protein n=1 Tax=Arundo donax TaxID=35708 RepID=A0A0A9AHM7_ARUDO
MADGKKPSNPEQDDTPALLKAVLAKLDRLETVEALLHDHQLAINRL